MISQVGLSTCILIILYNVLDGTGLLISYVIGVQNETIPRAPYVPYVSDLGDKSPNSSWFTLFLSSTCILLLLIVRVRFAFFKPNNFHWWNKFGYYTGLASIPGKLVVASFQLGSSKLIHYMGASLFFGASLLYIIIQLILTYKIQRSYGKNNNHQRSSRVLLALRVVLCLGMATSVAVFLPFALIHSLSVYNRYGMNVAQWSEWAAVFCNSAFLLTFIYDFWGVPVQHRVIIGEAVDEGADEIDAISPLLVKERKKRYGTCRTISLP